MNEKNEKKTPKNESVPATNPSIQSEIPGPPVEEIEVNQSEKDLDLLKNELQEPSVELTADFLPGAQKGFKEDDLDNPANASEEIPEDENVEQTFPDETVFKYPVDGREKTAYENILKANRETIKSLRLQVQEKTALISALEAELEAKGTEE
jgi:hypothetical protein